MKSISTNNGPVRYLLVGLLAGLFATVGAQVVVAATTATTVRASVVSAGDYCYDETASISNNTAPTATANTWVRTANCQSNSSVPVGYMQLQIISYRNGTVCSNKIGGTNQSVSQGASLNTSKDCGSGSYNAKAGVFAYQPSSGLYKYGSTVYSPGISH